MANDPSLALREAVVTRLLATVPLTSIVATSNIFGEQAGPMPERPFVRYGVDDTVPRRDSCFDGAEIEFPVHSFSAEKFTDEVRGMNAVVAAALDGVALDLEDGTVARLRWQSSTVNRDAGDPQAWHGIARFVATI